jgi:arylformamidase
VPYQLAVVVKEDSMNEVARRTFLGAGVVSIVLAARGPAFAQQPAPSQQAPRVKGPAVWLDMDQAELDAAYDQIQYAPNLPQIVKRYATNSEAVRARLGPPRRYAYGPTPIEALDVYTTKRENAPINIFIHGGAWRGGLAKDYGFPAELFVLAGAHYVVPDFINVVEAKGNLTPMAEQARRAVAWVYRNAQSFGGDPSRIYVSGHSSGGHLAGVVLVTDWRKDFNLPIDLVKGGLCCSGLFDLKPVRLSARSSYVKFTDDIEQALSSRRHLDKLNAPVIVAYGTLETPEFQRQSRDFAAAVKAAGKPVQLLVAEGYNHFEIPETLGNPYGLLGRAVLAQMNLSQA